MAIQKRRISRKGLSSLITTVLLIFIGLLVIAILGLVFQKTLLPLFEKKVGEGFDTLGEQSALVGGTNQAPVIDAGPIVYLAYTDEGAGVNLQGTASDSDGGPQPLNYRWEKVNGPDIVFLFNDGTFRYNDFTSTDPETLRILINFLASGIYVLRLSVTDGQLQATDTVTFIVTRDASAVETPLDFLASGLVAKWSFENNLQDTSGNVQHLEGSVLYSSTGPYNTFAQFSIKNTFAKQSNFTGLTGDAFSIAFWLKRDVPAGPNAIASFFADRIAFFQKGSNVSFYLQDVQKDLAWGSVMLEDDAWHHLALTYEISAGCYTLYLDSVPGACITLAERMTLKIINSIQLGGLISNIPSSNYPSTNFLRESTERYFNGSLDEVMIYNRSLSSSEISALYSLQQSKMLDLNTPPIVHAGADQIVYFDEFGNADAYFNGVVSDDGLPIPPGRVSTQWRLLSGPGPVYYTEDYDLHAGVGFDVPGVYIFSLTARDGLLSESDSVVIIVQSNVVTPVFIPAPSDVSLNVNRTSINVSWMHPAPASVLTKIYRARSSEGPWTFAAILPYGYQSYVDRNLLQSTLYYYTLFAFNATGDSAGSPIVNATTGRFASPAFAESSVSITTRAGSESSIIVSWNESRNITLVGGGP